MIPATIPATLMTMPTILMIHDPHNDTITYASIPNPNFAADSDIPRHAAIRFPNCVSGNEAQGLLAAM